jgi:hypothetical protein
MGVFRGATALVQHHVVEDGRHRGGAPSREAGERTRSPRAEVPFEANDGRGKDRPVLVIAVESAGTYLAVQLTSKDHDGEGDFVPIGAGRWDGEGRRPGSTWTG